VVLIAADTPDIERSLQKLVMLSKKAGAEFSDHMVVKCVDGSLSIAAAPDSAGKALMRLPWDCLVPLEPFHLSVIGDNIVMQSHEVGLTSACVAHMEAFIELYNLTNKLATHRRTSPWPLVASHPELLEYVTRGRGRGAYVISGKLYEPGKENELLLRSFLNSRVFNYKASGPETPNWDIHLEVLMPILDCMNHHFHGSLYSYYQQGEDRHVTVTRSAPLLGMGDECFACYGKHDAFDTWMTYGFIDNSVSFVCSVPMTLHLPDFGTMQLGSVIKSRDSGELPESDEDLYFYIPKLLTRGPNHIGVSSLLIPGPEAPRALLRTLHFLINEIYPGHPKERDLVLQAEAQVIAVNESYYRKLSRLLASLTPIDPLHTLVLGNFIRLCELQLARIQDYSGYSKAN